MSSLSQRFAKIKQQSKLAAGRKVTQEKSANTRNVRVANRIANQKTAVRKSRKIIYNLC